MTLPAAAARASADMDRYMGYAAPEADDRYLLPAPRLLQLADVVRRDGRTDGRTGTRPLHCPAPAYCETSVDEKVGRRRETVRRLVTDGQTDGWIQDDIIYRAPASIASLGIK